MPTVTQEMVDSLRLARDAIRLSDLILRKDPAQLASQLWGRLSREQAGAQRVLDSAVRHADRAWLRAVVPGLTAAGGPLVRVLEGHVGTFTNVAVLPDGRVVSGSDRGGARVWDPMTGETLRAFDRCWPKGGTVLPEGQVVSASKEVLEVWDPETGQNLQILEGHQATINCVAVLPDSRLVSGSDDGSLRVWDLEKGETVRCLQLTGAKVLSVAALHDGGVVGGVGKTGAHRSGLLPGHWRHLVLIWDPESGETPRALEGHTGWVNAVAVLPDCRVVSGSDDKTLRIWDLERGRVIRTLEGHSEEVTSLVGLPDGRVVSGSAKSTLRVWDPDDGEILHTLGGPAVMVMTYADAANRVLSGSGIGVLPNGWLVSGGGEVKDVQETVLRVWDPDREEAPQFLQAHQASVTCVAVLPDRRVASAAEDGGLRVWDPETGESVKGPSFNIPGPVNSLAMLPDGRVLASSHVNESPLLVWDPRSGETRQFGWTGDFDEEGEVAGVDGIDPVAVLPTCGVVSGSDDGTLLLWSPLGERVHALKRVGPPDPLEGHTGLVNSIVELPDGRLVSGSDDGTVRVWDLDDYPEAEHVLEHEHVTSVAALPSGRLISGSRDKTLQVWDPETGQALRTLEGHTGAVTSVTVLPDGRVVSYSADLSLRVWDPETGETICTLEGHTGRLSSVAVLPNGRVVSCATDRTVRVWDSTTGELIAKMDLDLEARAPTVITTSADGLIVVGDGIGRVHFLRLEEPGNGRSLS